jgi:hypothetical protein
MKAVWGCAACDKAIGLLGWVAATQNRGDKDNREEAVDLHL